MLPFWILAWHKYFKRTNIFVPFKNEVSNNFGTFFSSRLIFDDPYFGVESENPSMSETTWDYPNIMWESVFENFMSFKSYREGGGGIVMEHPVKHSFKNLQRVSWMLEKI